MLEYRLSQKKNLFNGADHVFGIGNILLDMGNKKIKEADHEKKQRRSA